jgi:hypothetical protein
VTRKQTQAKAKPKAQIEQKKGGKPGASSKKDFRFRLKAIDALNNVATQMGKVVDAEE